MQVQGEVHMVGSLIGAICPGFGQSLVLKSLLPAKEFGHNNIRWYQFLRWLKFAFLWVAAAFICWAAVDFVRAVYHQRSADDAAPPYTRTYSG